jgi:predicted unusual protein kinase regulating ubiquinone biosynthesis (AarF/ABC1/UbiB family)
VDPVPRRRLTVGERIYRARRIGTTFGRVYLGIKTNQFIERRLSPPDMKRRWSRFNLESAHSIYDAAVELRGLILKGCQFLGSRADVLPPEYVGVLSKLQDRVPAKPFRVVRRILEAELDRPLDAVFESLEHAPIASASLAQVHEGRLRSGERVAVKVQYPEIGSLVRSDLANLRTLFRAVGLIERELDLMPLIEELGTYVPRELDFVNEAHCAESVARFFDDRPDVHVPRVHWELTTRRVLVMEFVEGIKVNDLPALRAAGIDTNALMRTLIEAYCEQVLVRGLFHADPHPGNLMVQARPEGPRLVFVDFGLTKDLPPDFRHAVVGFAAAILTGDASGMARAMVELGFETRDGSPRSLERMAEVVLETAARFRSQAYVEPRLVRDAGDRLTRMVRENPIVRMPTHVVLLGRVLGLLSGLGRQLEARVDLVKTVLPYAAGSRGGRPAGG